MNLSEKIVDYQDEIQDNFVLIEYDLFFDSIPNCCAFVIDDREELKKFNNIIFKIKEMDNQAVIYVCTYIIDFTNRWKPIYADNIWINTVIDLKEVEALFENCREIEPCNVVLVSDDDTLDGLPAMVFSTDGKIQEFESFIEKKQLNNIKSLYWD